jgi:hypothetical protein
MAAKWSGRARIAGMGLRVLPAPTKNCRRQQVTGKWPEKTLRPRVTKLGRYGPTRIGQRARRSSE